MARRNYSKGPNRQIASSRDLNAAEMSARGRAISEELFTGVERWFAVYKNGVKLSYGKSLEHAKKHAKNCGGEVRAWNKADKQVETLFDFKESQ